MRTILAVLLPLALVACIAAPAPPPAGTTPAFSPIRFFDGRSEGAGVIHAVLRKDVGFHVHGTGAIGADGTLQLDQTIERLGRPVSRRRFRLREISPGRYGGTASDALDGVVAEQEGNRIHLRYRLASGYATDQWLTLAPDGLSAQSLLVLRKFGATVAVIRETIRKTG